MGHSVPPHRNHTPSVNLGAYLESLQFHDGVVEVSAEGARNFNMKRLGSVSDFLNCARASKRPNEERTTLGVKARLGCLTACVFPPKGEILNSRKSRGHFNMSAVCSTSMSSNEGSSSHARIHFFLHSWRFLVTCTPHASMHSESKYKNAVATAAASIGDLTIKASQG